MKPVNKNNKTPNKPVITANMVKSVSNYRRELLEKEAEAGLFEVPGGVIKSGASEDGKTRAGMISTGGMKKSAQLTQSTLTSSTTTGYGGYRGPSGTVRQTPEVYSPLWLMSNLNLPRDRVTINAWCRGYFALNPIVHNAISLHSTYPISKLNIRCKDKKLEDFYANMCEEIDLLSVCVQIAQEYWLLGEAFVFADLNENTGKWSKLVLQNPDYMNVKRNVVAGEPIMSLRPDENLRRLVQSNKPIDIQQKKQLSPSIIEHVKRGENIPLSNLYISHIARKVSPQESRGTGLVVNNFKTLMLLDKIFENYFVQADSMINPITLIKIGGPDYKPQPQDIEYYRQVWEEAQYDKDFKVFTHEGVAVEVVNKGAGIYDASSLVERLLKLLYIGLMVPQVLLDGGSDVTYANGGVTLDALKQRYMTFRELISKWLKRKIFAPIAEINEFYEYVDKEKRLILPDIEWNYMTLFDAGDYTNAITTLSTGQDKSVSKHTLYRSLGLDWDDERRKMKLEDIHEAIRAKEKESLENMSLHELRALDENSEIKEVLPSPLPGEDPSVKGPPEEEGGGLGEGLGGGLGGGLLPPPSGGLPPPPGGPPKE